MYLHFLYIFLITQLTMNNSQNYNQGMSFFGNYAMPEKEQDANADQHQVQILFILYYFLSNKI